MNFKSFVRSAALENRAFIALMIVVSLAFAWILWAFYGAVFWGAVLAIVFSPLFRWITARLRGRRTPGALLTLAVILVIVILPLALLSGTLVQEGSAVYDKIKSGDLNFARYFQQITAALPHWVTSLLDRFGLSDFAALQARITAAASQGSQLIATRLLDIGQNTFDFVVSFFITLYLAFFLLRDGPDLSRHIRNSIPLNEEHKRYLSTKFITVIRATVRGNIVVAAVQGALGGIAFWYLGIHGAVFWAVLMAFLSLLPAIGAGLVWAPVAIYFLVTGETWQGVGLILYCVLLIGLVDNMLRPILVGKDTKMPDYVVLISTLGGMGIFGINGFVIGPVIAAMFMAVWALFASARSGSEVDDEGLDAPAATGDKESIAEDRA